jgi:uncharacterized membrane protein
MGSRQVAAIIAGAVTLFVLGWLVYGMVLMDFFAANAGTATGVNREAMVWWALILGQVAWAGLLVYVFGRGAGVTSFGVGARVGAAVGLLAAASVDLALYATTNIMNLTAAVVDMVVWCVISAIGGGVVAAVLGRGAAAPAS